MNVFIDGDFRTDKKCKYHCSPTCHPGQLGPDWKYGCTHIAWEANYYKCWVPFVTCDGDPSMCEIDKMDLTRSEEEELKLMEVAPL